MIVNAYLKAPEVEKLLQVLRKNRGALEYRTSDLVGIDPKFCMHRIPLEEGHSPSIEGNAV